MDGVDKESNSPDGGKSDKSVAMSNVLGDDKSDALVSQEDNKIAKQDDDPSLNDAEVTTNRSSYSAEMGINHMNTWHQEREMRKIATLLFYIQTLLGLAAYVASKMNVAEGEKVNAQQVRSEGIGMSRSKNRSRARQRKKEMLYAALYKSNQVNIQKNLHRRPQVMVMKNIAMKTAAYAKTMATHSLDIKIRSRDFLQSSGSNRDAARSPHGVFKGDVPTPIPKSSPSLLAATTPSVTSVSRVTSHPGYITHSLLVGSLGPRSALASPSSTSGGQGVAHNVPIGGNNNGIPMTRAHKQAESAKNINTVAVAINVTIVVRGALMMEGAKIDFIAAVHRRETSEIMMEGPSSHLNFVGGANSSQVPPGGPKQNHF